MRKLAILALILLFPIAARAQGRRGPAPVPPVPPVPAVPAPLPAAPDALLTQLQLDYDLLLSKERNPQPIKEAAKLLGSTDRASHWTDYFKAVRILREERPKAAIPLLLMYAVKHANLDPRTAAEYATTLVLLTGEDISFGDGRGRASDATRAAVEKLVKDWWTPNQAKISTNFKDMSPDQLRRIVAVLQERARSELRLERGDMTKASTTVYLLRKVTGGDSREERLAGWCRQDLSPRLVHYMLEKTGYNPPAAGPGAAPADNADNPGPESLPIELVPLLGRLRQDGERAKIVDEVAVDPKQPVAARLVCLLALRAGGEKMPLDALLRITEKESRLAFRVPAILALGLAANKDQKAAAEAAIALLADPNEEVQAAAAWALEGLPSPAAVPALAKICDEVAPAEAVMPALMALGKIKNKPACDALAAFLTKAVNDDSSSRRQLMRALDAFDEATGCPIRRKPGAATDWQAQELAAARDALAWWRQQTKK